MPRRLFTLVAVVGFAAAASAQAPVTADAARGMIERFKAERADTAKTFNPEELAAADEQAAKAEAELAAGNAARAVRLITDARWQLPVLPKDLPANVVRVLGAGRLRHGDRVNAVAYSPDGARLVTASRDGTVRVWDVGNGRELLVYRGHEAAAYTDPQDKEKANVFRVAGVAFSPDGKRIASCGADEIHVWEADTGKVVATLKGHKKDVSGVAFAHKNANLLASVGDDKKLILWDVAAGKPTFTSDEQSTRIEAVAFSPQDNQVALVDGSGALAVFLLDGEKVRLGYGGQASDARGLNTIAFAADGVSVFVGGMDSKIKRVSGPTGPESVNGNTLMRYEGHTDGVASLAITPDGKQLVSLDGDRLVLVWDVERGQQLRAFPGESALKSGTCVTVRPDGRQIAVGYDSGSVRLISFAAVDDHRGHAEAADRVWTVCPSPTGKTFAAAGADRVIRVYDTATGKVTKELAGHKLAVTAVAYLNEGTLVSSGGDKLVKVWDIAAGSAKDCTGHTLAVLSVAVGPNGRQVVSGSADKSVRGWDPASGQEVWKWQGRSAVCGLSVAADGKRVAVGCADGKLTLLVVNGSEVKVTGEIGAHTAGVACVAFSPDGERVVTCGGDGGVSTWAAPAEGTPVLQTKFDPPFKLTPGSPVMPVTSVAFSADGKQIVGGGAEGVVRVWDANTGSEVRGLRGHAGWVTAVAFTPDGRGVLSAGVDQTARLFDLPGADTAESGHRGGIQCVAVSRDGKRIATGGADRTVRVWDVATGREVATLTGESDIDGLWAVVFVGNDRVAACGQDKKLRVWSISPAKLLTERPTTNTTYSLASSPDGTTIGGAWTDVKSNGPSESGFDLFVGDAAPSVTKSTSKSGDDATSAAAMSPDAQWGVTGGNDGVVRIWEVGKKQRVGGDWPLLKSKVFDLGLTPDRKRVVVLNESGEVKVADTEKREVLKTFQAVTGEPRGIIVSPNGDKFATLNGDGEVKAWDFTGQELRSWKLPHAPNCAVFATSGKRLIVGNQDGTAFVLELP